MKKLLFPILALVALGTLPSCVQVGPAAPSGVGSPSFPVLIDPRLTEAVGIPETHPPTTTFTPDGRMKYIFHLQNQTDRQINLQYQTTFYDEGGVPIDEQLPRTQFLPAAQIRPFTVTSTSEDAKKVSVQVKPHE